MDTEKMLSSIDHTCLKAYATWEDIDRLCREALEFHTASVCIPPAFIKRVREAYPELNICTVIGFPLGYNTTEIKAAETRQAISDGADEVDMVINIGEVKAGNFSYVEEEIGRIRSDSEGKILKVIIETCYLTEEEKVRLCEIVTRQKADYIKTSTGFGTGGATREDIRLFAENIGPEVKIKAAGGVKTLQDMEDFINLGADRIGSSSAVGLFK